jgi:hypothetical protein
VDVVVSAFAPERGRPSGSWRQRLNLAWNPTDSAAGHYEVMSRLQVAPGRYELRAGIQTGDGRTSSVYAHVDVPDFGREPLSLSGLILSVTPSPRMAPRGAFRDLMPVEPTSRRILDPTDRVTGFLRVYQGGSRQPIPVIVTTRLIDAANTQLSEHLQNVEGAAFMKTRSFDYRFDVPVQDLARGEYLLTVDVAAGEKRAHRSLRFRVR